MSESRHVFIVTKIRLIPLKEEQMSRYLRYCNIDVRYKTFAKTFVFKKMQTNVLQQKKMLNLDIFLCHKIVLL